MKMYCDKIKKHTRTDEENDNENEMKGCNIEWKEVTTQLDEQKNITMVLNDDNCFVDIQRYGIILIALQSNNTQPTTVYAFSQSLIHGTQGNTRIQISYMSNEEWESYKAREKNGCMQESVQFPVLNTIATTVAKLKPTTFDETNEFPKTQFSYLAGPNPFYLRVYSVDDSLQVGAVIDARDFTGRWFQAEIVAIRDNQGREITHCRMSITNIFKHNLFFYILFIF